MTVTVTTHAQASDQPVHIIRDASRWETDAHGYLHVWQPDGIIATFAPGWISVTTEGTTT